MYPLTYMFGYTGRITLNSLYAVARVCGAGSVACRFTHVYPDGPAPYYTVIARGRRGSSISAGGGRMRRA